MPTVRFFNKKSTDIYKLTAKIWTHPSRHSISRRRWMRNRKKEFINFLKKEWKNGIQLKKERMKKESTFQTDASASWYNKFIFRIKQAKPSLGQRFLVSNSQVRTGWIRCTRISPWFTRKMNTTRTKSCKFIWTWDSGTPAASEFSRKWTPWEDKPRNYPMNLCDQ